MESEDAFSAATCIFQLRPSVLHLTRAADNGGSAHSPGAARSWWWPGLPRSNPFGPILVTPLNAWCLPVCTYLAAAFNGELPSPPLHSKLSNLPFELKRGNHKKKKRRHKRRTQSRPVLHRFRFGTWVVRISNKAAIRCLMWQTKEHEDCSPRGQRGAQSDQCSCLPIPHTPYCRFFQHATVSCH